MVYFISTETLQIGLLLSLAHLRQFNIAKYIEKNMFAGFLKCSDCGANLNDKYTHDNPNNHYFSCRNKGANNGLCSQTHHIRADTITNIVIQHLSSIVRFASLFEDEQAELRQKIKHLKAIVAEEQKHEMNAEGFLQLVRQYTDIRELTP